MTVIINSVGLVLVVILAVIATRREKYAEATTWLAWAIMFKLNLLNS